MDHTYLGLIPFAKALELEQQAWSAVVTGPSEGVVLGFESEPVITLGVRGGPEDLLWSESERAARGFSLVQLERGGQATLHNPGQLVIFPIMRIQEIGARAWVEQLLAVTGRTLKTFGAEVSCRKGQPGLFSSKGKVVSIGVRVRQGISTHGLAINVCNDLSHFEGIRPCGIIGAPMDRVGGETELVFAEWIRNFQRAAALGLTSSGNLNNLECSDVRL